MAKKRAGKYTKVLTTDDVSPMDPKEPLTSTWMGRIMVSNAQRSQLAKKLEISKEGEYAIKVR
ncbi:MAG: RNA polymerase subunit RPABC4/transcription elongation factor Spt4 [Candidatus Woesearchaeota archaeon]|jgi:RNA polymerase subunit RPABC4/transcription elongation factor Spt4